AACENRSVITGRGGSLSFDQRLHEPRRDGSTDVEAASEDLGRRLPAPLRPVATLAFNYRWSWAPGAAELLRSVDAARWDICGENPVRVLQEVSPARLDRLADDRAFIARIDDLAADLALYLERPPAGHGLSPRHPVAYFCSE